MPPTDLTKKKAKRALKDAAARAELKKWKIIDKAGDKARATNSPAPALPELSARAEKLRRRLAVKATKEREERSLLAFLGCFYRQPAP